MSRSRRLTRPAYLIREAIFSVTTVSVLSHKLFCHWQQDQNVPTNYTRFGQIMACIIPQERHLNPVIYMYTIYIFNDSVGAIH